MAIKTVVPSDNTPAYADFANALSWDLNELSFRAHAALEVLHGTEEIDTDRDGALALSYLLRGIANRAEELALRAADTGNDYVAKSQSQLRSAA